MEQPAGTSASAAEELNTRDHRENARQDEPPAHGHRGVAEPGHDHHRDYVDNQQYNQGVRHSRVRTLSLAYRVICRHLFSVGLGYTHRTELCRSVRPLMGTFLWGLDPRRGEVAGSGGAGDVRQLAPGARRGGSGLCQLGIGLREPD